MERIAILPGSFDPITVGHVKIIEKALLEYDRVYVAVMINNQKKYMFNLEQRESIAKAALKKLERVIVISSEDWLWKLSRELGVCAIVKGYRNETDLKYEKEMAKFNEEKNPDCKTVFVKADEEFLTVSSTLVREHIIQGKPINQLVPEGAIEEIYKITEKYRNYGI